MGQVIFDDSVSGGIRGLRSVTPYSRYATSRLFHVARGVTEATDAGDQVAAADAATSVEDAREALRAALHEELEGLLGAASESCVGCKPAGVLPHRCRGSHDDHSGIGVSLLGCSCSCCKVCGQLDDDHADCKALT
jgi:hypothetical protein